MKHFKRAAFILCLTATLSYADSWTGKLVNAGCWDRIHLPTPDANVTPTSTTEPCDATPSATTFALLTPDGKFLRFDPESNVKTATALLGFPDAKGPTVKVTGTVDGGIVKVEAIEIR